MEDTDGVPRLAARRLFGAGQEGGWIGGAGGGNGESHDG
jgi:hypothetical protein